MTVECSWCGAEFETPTTQRRKCDGCQDHKLPADTLAVKRQVIRAGQIVRQSHTARS